ncbi:MAG: SAUR-like auxin-responsive family protein [Sweet potato little leaf phytoplasma]|nr:SAUR-like auxin-responsive family protein [Sweet potato little leaf phytoplasma]
MGKQKQMEVVPKGHLAVYLGGGDGGETRRAVVPVVYVNHPLFGELLKESERVYGYNQAGRIVIPCGYSEFEKVRTRIAAWDDYRKGSQWRHKEELKYRWS